MKYNNKYSKQEQPNFADNGTTSNFNFKDHREFFDVYFPMRSKMIMLLVEAKYDKKLWKDLYNSVESLIEWTSNYIKDLDAVDELLKQALQEYKQNKVFTSIDTLKKLVRLLNKEHERADILPQQQITEENEIDQYWKKEENKAIREAKKAFTDILKNAGK